MHIRNAKKILGPYYRINMKIEYLKQHHQKHHMRRQRYGRMYDRQPHLVHSLKMPFVSVDMPYSTTDMLPICKRLADSAVCSFPLRTKA